MSPEEKAAAAKKRAEDKKAEEKLRPVVVVQYQGIDTDITNIAAAVRSDIKERKGRTRILNLKIYVKPEDRTAYYVMNGKFEGKVTI